MRQLLESEEEDDEEDEGLDNEDDVGDGGCKGELAELHGCLMDRLRLSHRFWSFFLGPSWVMPISIKSLSSRRCKQSLVM